MLETMLTLDYYTPKTEESEYPMTREILELVSRYDPQIKAIAIKDPKLPSLHSINCGEYGLPMRMLPDCYLVIIPAEINPSTGRTLSPPKLWVYTEFTLLKNYTSRRSS